MPLTGLLGSLNPLMGVLPRPATREEVINDPFNTWGYGRIAGGQLLPPLRTGFVPGGNTSGVPGYTGERIPGYGGSIPRAPLNPLTPLAPTSPYSPSSSPYGPLSTPDFSGGFGGGPDMGTNSNFDLGGLDVRGIATTLGAAGCARLGPTAMAVCLQILNQVTGSQQSSTGSTATQQTTPGGQCPPGFKMTSNGCAKEGMAGTVQRFLPGGQSGYAWDPISGVYGAGVVPVARETMTMVCPNGWVLGNDNTCYQRLERRFRKHLPTRKPLLTANDGRILSRARTLEKKLKRVAGKHVRKTTRCNCAKPAVGRKK